jgi:hypothetical protein
MQIYIKLTGILLDNILDEQTGAGKLLRSEMCQEAGQRCCSLIRSKAFLQLKHAHCPLETRAVKSKKKNY